MRQFLRTPTLCFIMILSTSVTLVPPLTPSTAQALTASLGQPYHGSLSNGIPFPRQFNGYVLRDEDHTYTTPEVIGAMLDAIDAVQKQFPNSAPIYLGDFSTPNGGPMTHHRSHQNGRDVDIGMYAKGNRALETFAPMTEENLDVPKTWAFIEALLRSQRVQYLFVDRRIQNLLQDYALAQGLDAGYLDRLFGNSRGAIIQHVRNHVDHMHVRFYTPWSTLAAHVSNLDDQKRAVIEMAQQAYLPKKVFYYAKGSEGGLDHLALSFGVSRRDLCRWNNLHGTEVPTPGSCIVFYKRGFEMEPVHLAQTLQPDSVPEAPGTRFAALRSPRSLSDASGSGSGHSLRDFGGRDRNRRHDSPVVFTYTVKRGDTIDKIARRNGIDPKVLADANRIKSEKSLQVGQQIKLAGLKIPAGALSSSASDPRSRKDSRREDMRALTLDSSTGRGSRDRESSRPKDLKPSPTAKGTKESRDTKEARTRDRDKDKKLGDRGSAARVTKEAVKDSKGSKSEKVKAPDTRSPAKTKSEKPASVSTPNKASSKPSEGSSKGIEPKKAPSSSGSKASPPAGMARDSKQVSKKTGT